MIWLLTLPPSSVSDSKSIGETQEDWERETACWRERDRCQILRRREPWSSINMQYSLGDIGNTAGRTIDIYYFWKGRTLNHLVSMRLQNITMQDSWIANIQIIGEFSKNFEKVLMGFSGAGGKLIDEKNQKRKISWHCPFKGFVSLKFLRLCLNPTTYTVSATCTHYAL